MNDWTKQTEEMINTWTKAQQQLWEGWKAALPSAGGPQSAAAWEQVIGYWKDAIDKSLGAQVEWANMWANSVKSQPNAPKELGAWTDQMVETMKTWTDSQARLWESMLDSTKQLTPELLAQRMDEGAQAAFKNWRDAVQKAVDAQKELAKYWTVETK